jgi:hypothetical protein
MSPRWSTRRDTQNASTLVLQSPTILLTGLDTVVFYGRGKLAPGFAADLRAARGRQHEPLEETGQHRTERIALAGMTFELSPVPVRQTPFVLRCAADHGTTVAVSPLSAKQPFSYVLVRLGARLCAGAGIAEIYEIAWRLVTACLLMVEHAHITELDIHVDFHGWRPPMESPESWSRGNMPSLEYGLAKARREATALCIGYRPAAARGKVAIRIENKSAEIRDHSHKEWLFVFYAQIDAIWSPDIPVYRVEVRLKRDALAKYETPDGKSMKSGDEPFDAVSRALNNVPAIWRKVMFDHRLTLPGQAKQRCRWKTDPRWEALTLAFGAGPAVTTTRARAAQETAAKSVIIDFGVRAHNAARKALAAALVFQGSDVESLTDERLATMLAAQVGAAPDRTKLHYDMEEAKKRGVVTLTFEDRTLDTPASTPSPLPAPGALSEFLSQSRTADGPCPTPASDVT